MAQTELHSYKMAPPVRETGSLPSEGLGRHTPLSFQINRSSEGLGDSEEAHIPCPGADLIWDPTQF